MSSVTKTLGLPSVATLLCGIGLLCYSSNVQNKFDSFCESYRDSVPGLVQVETLNDARDHIKDSHKALTSYSRGKSHHSPDVSESIKDYNKALNEAYTIKDTERKPIFEETGDIEAVIERLEDVKTQLENTKQWGIFRNNEKKYSAQREAIDNSKAFVEATAQKIESRIPKELDEQRIDLNHKRKLTSNLGIIGTIVGGLGAIGYTVLKLNDPYL